MTNRTRNIVAVIVLVLFAAALAVCTQRGRDPDSTIPPVLQHRSGGLVFTYHTPTGTEGLFDRAQDPQMLHNLAAERPADLRRLREEMLKALEVESLEELRQPQQELIDRLRGLGYF